MKSVKEISEITGISKVSLYKLIKKPELEGYTKKEHNTTFIDEIGEQIIKEYYARQRLTSLNDILDESTGLQEAKQVKEDLIGVNEVYNTDVIRILENQLNNSNQQLKEKASQIKIKDEQISRKDDQIHAMLVLLNKEKDIKLINDSNYVNRQQQASEEPENKPKKENLLHRIFRKK